MPLLDISINAQVESYTHGDFTCLRLYYFRLSFSIECDT